MSLVVNTNTTSLRVSSHLSTNTNDYTNSIKRLSTGYKINSASDDAAGLAISKGFETQISGNLVAKDNAQIGVNLLQTAEGDMETIKSHLQRIRDLSVQAANGTYSTDERKMLTDEATSRLNEINRIAAVSSFNDIKLLDGSTTDMKLQVGANSGANNLLDISSAVTKCTGTALSANLTTTKITTAFNTAAGANVYINTLDAALKKLSGNISKIGATQNTVEAIVNNLDTKTENLSSSLSAIKDTDIALEASNNTKLNILQNIQVALLSQANTTPSVALTLI